MLVRVAERQFPSVVEYKALERLKQPACCYERLRTASSLSTFKDAHQSGWPLWAGKPWSSMWSSANWVPLVLADGPDQVDPVPISDVRIGDRGPRRPGGCNDLSGVLGHFGRHEPGRLQDNRQVAVDHVETGLLNRAPGVAILNPRRGKHPVRGKHLPNRLPALR